MKLAVLSAVRWKRSFQVVRASMVNCVIKKKLGSHNLLYHRRQSSNSYFLLWNTLWRRIPYRRIEARRQLAKITPSLPCASRTYGCVARGRCVPRHVIIESLVAILNIDIVDNCYDYLGAITVNKPLEIQTVVLSVIIFFNLFNLFRQLHSWGNLNRICLTANTITYSVTD